ncbi:MAG: hypothetical protein LKE37_07330 [Atopobiaceae bacterium]|jgi:predicted secreted protein|nr:hypothetical protein [Atopobiaceae bacterium]
MDEAYSPAIAQVVRGHWLLALCTVFYLVWWIVFFRPRAEGVEVVGMMRAFGIGCILAAAALGVAAVWQIGSGAGALPGPVEGVLVNGGGLLAYLVLLMVTIVAFKREPTTELLLFVGWATLEANVLNGLAGAGTVPTAVLVVLGVVVAAGLVASTVCYVLYYGLPAFAGFVDGCIPLVVVGIISVVLAVAIA